jgi:hypothetical protein
MLVDISFTVNLDEIPKRLSDLFLEDIQRKYLGGLSTELVEIETMLTTNNMSDKLIDKIDLLRRNLALADMRLKNISVIAEGYVKIREDQHKQEQLSAPNDLKPFDEFSDSVQEIVKTLQLTKRELENEQG